MTRPLLAAAGKALVYLGAIAAGGILLAQLLVHAPWWIGVGVIALLYFAHFTALFHGRPGP